MKNCLELICKTLDDGSSSCICAKYLDQSWIFWLILIIVVVTFGSALWKRSRY